jgi:putative transposase
VSSRPTSAGPLGSTRGKKVKGRKRHIVVDVLGLILSLCITPASVQDRDGAVPVLREAHREHPTLRHVWVDSAYRGEVIDDVGRQTGIEIEVVKRPEEQRGFVLLKRRWIVERTNGWFGKFRILSKEYERTIESSHADVLLAMTSVMMRRLTTPPEARKERR